MNHEILKPVQMISLNSNFSDNFNTFDLIIALVKIWLDFSVGFNGSPVVRD